MTRYRSSDVAFLLIDGLSVLGETTDLGESKEATFEETTPLGTGGLWETYEPVGLTNYNLTQAGFYNDAAGSSNAALAAVSGASRVLNFGVETNAKNKRFKGFEAPIQVKYHRESAKGGLTKATAEYKGSGEYEEGLILLEFAVQATGATNNTEAALYVDYGAAGMPTTNGGTGFFQVTSYTAGGGSGLVMKIRQATTLPTWTDLLTFTSIAAVGAERKTVAGSVPRYLAVSWTFTGGGAGSGFTGFVGFHRNP